MSSNSRLASPGPRVLVAGQSCVIVATSTASADFDSLSCIAPARSASTFGDTDVVVIVDDQASNAGNVSYDRPVVRAVEPASIDAIDIPGTGTSRPVLSIFGVNFGVPPSDLDSQDDHSDGTKIGRRCDVTGSVFYIIIIIITFYNGSL